MRTTSSVINTEFPFADDQVPFILVIGSDGHSHRTKDHRGFEHASTRDKKVQLLEFAKGLDAEGVPFHLLAAWPGATRTDVFDVDDLDEALAAF